MSSEISICEKRPGTIRSWPFFVSNDLPWRWRGLRRSRGVFRGVCAGCAALAAFAVAFAQVALGLKVFVGAFAQVALGLAAFAGAFARVAQISRYLSERLRWVSRHLLELLGKSALKRGIAYVELSLG